MALTAAERAKRYREKIKQNPEKYEQHKKKELKRLKKAQKKINELTEEEKGERRKKWREQKKIQKEKNEALLYISTDWRRKMVSVEQINSLLEFMKEHPDLAKGLSRGRRGKLTTVKVWNSCAIRLNFLKEGAVKDGKGWSKYWCDWKYRVRRHALELKAAKESNRPAPDGLTPLSSIEETIMSIIGEESLNSVQIKTDPLAEEESNEEVPEIESNEHSNNEEPTNQFNSAHPENRKRRKAPSREFSDDDNDDSSPTEKKARLEEESDEEDGLSLEFLRMEREKLDQLRNMTHTLEGMLTQMTRVAEAVDRIHSYLLS